MDQLKRSTHHRGDAQFYSDYQIEDTEAFQNTDGVSGPNDSAGVQTSPTFGVITSVQDPRDLQFGLKLLF